MTGVQLPRSRPVHQVQADAPKAQVLSGLQRGAASSERVQDQRRQGAPVMVRAVSGRRARRTQSFRAAEAQPPGWQFDRPCCEVCAFRAGVFHLPGVALIGLEGNIGGCGCSAWSRGRGPQSINIWNGMYASEITREQKMSLPLQDPSVQVGSKSCNRQCQKIRNPILV